MDLTRYEYKGSIDKRYFTFFSDGPKGRIKKVVVYSKMDAEPVLYNLAFGDEDPVTGEVKDDIRSNNGDRDIILATVAVTIKEFSDRHNNPYVYAVEERRVGQDCIR